MTVSVKDDAEAPDAIVLSFRSRCWLTAMEVRGVVVVVATRRRWKRRWANRVPRGSPEQIRLTGSVRKSCITRQQDWSSGEDPLVLALSTARRAWIRPCYQFTNNGLRHSSSHRQSAEKLQPQRCRLPFQKECGVLFFLPLRTPYCQSMAGH
jgi:hypothetical protein